MKNQIISIKEFNSNIIDEKISFFISIIDLFNFYHFIYHYLSGRYL
jgi:hypothetical protein